MPTYRAAPSVEKLVAKLIDTVDQHRALADAGATQGKLDFEGEDGE